MGKRAFHTAVCHAQTALHPVLIRTGDTHHIFEPVDIIAAKRLILNARRVCFNHGFLALGIENWQSVFHFVRADQLCRFHTPYEQLGHLCIDFVDDGAGFF